METLWDRQRFEPAAFCLTMTSLYFTAIANGNSKMYNTEDMQVCIEQAGLKIEEIYDGLGNTWDYGPVGNEIKTNIKRAWWNMFVHRNRGTYGVDASILMNPRVWEASGHTASFSDPKIDCKECKTRHRADNLIEDFAPSIFLLAFA